MRYVDNRSKMEIEAEEEKKMSLWKFGKKQFKEFTNYHVKKSTFIKTTIFGILLSILVLLPVIFLIITFYKVFAYNPKLKVLTFTIIWIVLLIYNGLSNYFTVQSTKNYILDDEKLQKFDARAIAFYNILNPLFMIFSFIVIMFLMIGGLSC